MERCKQCGEYRNLLDGKGICVFCRSGPGGNPIEKRVGPDQGHLIGKPVKSAVTEE